MHAPWFLAGWRRWPITRVIKTKVVDPCVSLFSRGLDMKHVSFSLALGLTVGVFPLCGLTTVLCALVVLLLRSRCDGPTMFLATLLATPLELSLIIPYVRLGEALLGMKRLSVTPSALVDALRGGGSTDILLRLAASVLAWLLTAPALVWVAYNVTLLLALRLGRRIPTSSSSSALLGHKAAEQPQAEVPLVSPRQKSVKQS